VNRFIVAGTTPRNHFDRTGNSTPFVGAALLHGGLFLHQKSGPMGGNDGTGNAISVKHRKRHVKNIPIFHVLAASRKTGRPYV